MWRCAAATHHVLDVVDVAAGDDGDVDVGHVGEALQRVLGLERQRGEVGVRRDGRQRAVVVQQQRQLLRVPDVSDQYIQLLLLESPNGHKAHS